jgi:natural product precursor
MKKIEIKGKLSLNKSTIANLNNEQMNAVKGGAEAGDGVEAIDKSVIRVCVRTILRLCSDCPGVCNTHPG